MSNTIPGAPEQNQNDPQNNNPNQGQGPDGFNRFPGTPLGHMAQDTPDGVRSRLTMPNDPSAIDPNTYEVNVDKQRPINMTAEQWQEYQRLRSKEATNKNRKGLRAAIAAVVGTAIVGGGAALALRDDEPKNTSTPQPTASAPLTPGPTASESVPAPTQEPSANQSTGPVDPEQSLANEAEQKRKKLAELRAPFTNLLVDHEDLAPLLAKSATLENLSDQYVTDRIENPENFKLSPNIVPNSPLFDLEAQKSFTTEKLQESRAILQKFHSDRNRVNALIAKVSQNQGVDLSIEDLYVTEADLKGDKKTAATKLANVPVAYLRLAAEIERENLQNTNGGDVDNGQITAYELISAVRIADQPRAAGQTLVQESLLYKNNPKPKAGEINPATALLLTSYPGGVNVEHTNPEGAGQPALKMPLYTTYGTGEVTLPQGQGNRERTSINVQSFVPAEFIGKPDAVVPVILDKVYIKKK